MKHFLFICLLAGSLLSLGMTGGTPETVVVPNVEGVSLELAAQILRNADLQPQGQSAALSARVARQEPRPGFEVAAGSVVVLFVEGQGQTLPRGADVGLPTSTIASQTSRTIVQSPQTGATAPLVSAGRAWNMHVTVTPQEPATTAIQGQASTQSGTLPEPRSPLVSEPPQTSVTLDGTHTQTRRVYPVWYPRQFISESASSTPRVAATQPQIQALAAPLFSADVVTVSPAASPTLLPDIPTDTVSIQHYPALDAWSDGESSLQAQSAQATTRTGVIQTSTSPAVAVPNVARLPQQDAIAALLKAGLQAGAPMLVDSAQARSGCVVQQAPQPRQLVPAGTAVQLWIAR